MDIYLSELIKLLEHDEVHGKKGKNGLYIHSLRGDGRQYLTA